MPRSDEDFEEKCIPLFANLVGDPNFKRVASRGKNQEGIDLIGSRDRDPHQPVGVQCKLRTKGQKLTEDEVRSDVGRALKITPKLTEIYYVTTADDDLAYDKLALTLRIEQKAQSRDVDIQIWGWGELQRRIRQDPEALRAFDPNYSASTNLLLEQAAATLAATETGVEMTSVLMSQQAKMSEHLAQLVAIYEIGPQEQIDQLLDEQLNQIRDLLNTGRPATARSLLERLESNEAVRSPRIKARLKAYLGFAQLKAGHEGPAIELFFEAYELYPDDPKNRANRILALTLQGKLKQAIHAAHEVLANDSSNATAAAFAYQAAALSKGKYDPDSFVPQDLRTDESVAFHRINFLRAHLGDWVTAARIAHEADPSSRLLGRFAAEALLDQAFNRTRASQLTEAERATLLEGSIALLQPYWDDVRNYENASEQGWLSVGLNLATAYRASHDIDALRRVTGELLALAPTDDDVVVAAAHLNLIEGQLDQAADRLLQVAESPQRTMVLLLALAEGQRWQQILDLVTDDRLKSLDAFDRDIAEANALRARLELSDQDDLEEIINGYAGRETFNIPSAVIVADFAHRLSHPCLEAILDRAEAELVGADLRDRLLYAEVCGRSGQYERVIRSLDGHVDISKPSDPLAWLALAFANAPTRPRTHAFFASLQPEIISQSRFARLAAAADNARGDLKNAERHARRALEDDPADLRTHLLLQNILERSNRRTDAAKAIDAIDENIAVGTPLDRMHLAMLLRRHGRVRRAIEIGFETASKNRDNERLVSKYPGLIFLNENLPAEIGEITEIKPGLWFSLEGINTPSITGLMSSDTIQGIDNYPENHPLSKELLGKSVEDEVVLRGPFGQDRRYKVTEIKHRFIWLLHDITKSHATRFPDSGSMIELTLVGDDIQPVLDVARQSSEKQDAILTTYESRALPLEALAGIFHKSVLAISELITQLGGSIRTCVGTEEERNSALIICKKAQGSGIVLDTVTAWNAHQLDLLPLLNDHFGVVAIAQSTIDELLELREAEELNVGREYITIGFEGAQAVRQIHSPEETNRRIDIFNRAISALHSGCIVLPVEGTDDTALNHLLDVRAMQDMLDPILLARQHNYMLLSDDLHLRQLASQFGVNRSSWIQAFSMMERDSGVMTRKEYARVTSRLAVWKHDHIALDADTMIEILQLDEHPDPYFDLTTEFIGGERADILSHIGVVADFINNVWSAPIEFWRKGRAAGRAIGQLLKCRVDWKQVLGTLIAVIPKRPRRIASRTDLSLDYVGSWIRGHFLYGKANTKHRKRKKS